MAEGREVARAEAMDAEAMAVGRVVVSEAVAMAVDSVEAETGEGVQAAVATAAATDVVEEEETGVAPLGVAAVRVGVVEDSNWVGSGRPIFHSQSRRQTHGKEARAKGEVW